MGNLEIQLHIEAKRDLTPDICEFRLIATHDQLPPVWPGAHITVATPTGARRRYSITHASATPTAYTIAVQREPDGRGGSLSLIEQTRRGESLTVQPPVNEFPLQSADEYLFIAGGIGITPILAMIRELQRTGQRNYRLIYLTRDATHTAYLAELREFAASGEIVIHHDGGEPENFFDLWPDLEQPGQRHLYYCGPAPLMEEIDAMTGHWPADQVHFESFAATVQAVQADDRAFTIVCARSGLRVMVASDQSALEALRSAGVNIPSSCESGTCGSCRTRLLFGAAMHRDMVLRDDEQTSQIMLCVSRAEQNEITIDL